MCCISAGCRQRFDTGDFILTSRTRGVLEWFLDNHEKAKRERIRNPIFQYTVDYY